MATIKQVSKLANVSTATVSRVINNQETVRAATRERVEAAMKTLGYNYNIIAASLAANQTNTVGYVVPELHGTFFGTMMSGTEKVLRSANKHMIVATGHSNEKMEKEAIDDLLRRRCDALILHLEAVSDDYLTELSEQKVPFVLVNRFIPAIEESCIALDNEYGGYIATKHLIQEGHTKIAYISGSLWKADASFRLTGHKKALEEAGITFEQELLFEGNFQVQSGQDAIEQFTSQNVEFTAVACGNDEMAAGAMKALRRIGLDVPKHVSLVGFDNSDFAPYLHPALSTVNYPADVIGEMAAEWILNRVYKRKFNDFEHVLKPSFLRRESCGPAAS